MLLNSSMKDFSFFKDMLAIPDAEFMNGMDGHNALPYTCNHERDSHFATMQKLGPLGWRFGDEAPDNFYYHNSFGFRNDQDFDDVDWENTYALVGCSYVYGQAVENHNTISSILTSEYNMPTINFGTPGASNRVIHNNAIHAIKKYKPKKVIILWSHPNRNNWTHNYNVENKHWEHTHIVGSTVSSSEMKKMVRQQLIPYEFVHMDYSHHTLYEWKVYQDIHELLGTAQYSVDGKNKGILQEAEWIKPKDTKYYEMRLAFETKEVEFDWNNPEHMEYINDFFARDLHLASRHGNNIPGLGHYGRSINRDIADLIYRENFT